MPRIKKAGPWNPQKAEAYVGKGVLKYGDTIPAIRKAITPVPNGPLIKKKGEFKGSTLKNGGMTKVPKAQPGRNVKLKKVRLKEDSRDYITKIKTDPEGPEGNVASIRVRRTLKGFLTGAPRAKKIMKNGGKTPAWTRSEGKDPKGGLNRKGVASYRAANPGSKLKMAVTTKPSKLKPGSEPAKRRRSFCARMSGVKGPMRKNGKPTRKALALRKWNC